MANIKMGKSNSYAGKKHGKKDYGCGGFGGQPRVCYSGISEERWNLIKWDDSDEKGNDGTRDWQD